MSFDFDRKLFSSDFQERLTRLRLILKHRLPSSRAGSNLAGKMGSSIEFQEYIPYSHGEDVRYLDWNLYARTEELFLKRFQKEESLHLRVFLDASASMREGNPPKFCLAQQLTASIAYLGLHCGHGVQVGILQEKQLRLSPFYYHPAQILSVFQFLSSSQSMGKLEWKKAFTSFFSHNRPGSIWICSDFLHGKESMEILQNLRKKGYEITLFHLLSEEDIRGLKKGDFILRDTETQSCLSLQITEKLLHQYQKVVEKFREKWRLFSDQQQINYHFTSNAVQLEKIILEGLSKAGWLR